MSVVSADIAIVGAGECGARAAFALRELGHRGAVLLVGDEALAPYERPPLSKTTLAGSESPAPTTAFSSTALASAGITFLAGTSATSIDTGEQVVALADGRLIRYGRLLLATGARARRLSIPGGEHAIVLRTYPDACAVRARLLGGGRVVIIGGGFIGLEVAASATAHGCNVSVIEVAPRLLARAVPSPVASILEERHRRAGVAFHLGVGVSRITRLSDGSSQVSLNDGTVVNCDLVIAGVGSVPETSIAEAAGLAIDNGIAVDNQLRTSVDSIWAAGDCCSFPHPAYDDERIRLESWRNAHDQAVLAAQNMLGAANTYDSVPWFWSDQYELGLQVAGLPSMATEEVLRTRADGTELRFGLHASGRLLSVSGVAKGTTVAKDIRIGEMMIARRIHPEVGALSDPRVGLKSLLA